LFFSCLKRSNPSCCTMNAHGNPHELHITGCAARRALLRALICLCLLAGPLACPYPCRAQDARPEASDNQTLQVRFFSLKPGSSIAPATLRLRCDNTLGIAFEKEALADVQGTWSLRNNRFSAAAEFTADRRPLFHYRLALNGFGAMGRCVGRARLSEYDRQDRLMQEIEFLFYAEAPGVRALPGFGGNGPP
jgi:hypothetical protein